MTSSNLIKIAKQINFDLFVVCDRAFEKFRGGAGREGEKEKNLLSLQRRESIDRSRHFGSSLVHIIVGRNETVRSGVDQTRGDEFIKYVTGSPKGRPVHRNADLCTSSSFGKRIRVEQSRDIG